MKIEKNVHRIVNDHFKKNEVNSSQANLKRLQSLKNLKKNYKSRRSVIQTALSQVDKESKNKIIFDDDAEIGQSKESELGQTNAAAKKSLFENDHSDEDDFKVNFSVKQQFQGKEGQKLLELQAKYKNDKRFTLDSRFLDGEVEITNHNEENQEISLEEEKKKEFEILGQVLGKKITPKLLGENEMERQKKKMLRFDPSQPDHLKYQLEKEADVLKKKKKKDSNINMLQEKKQEEKDLPQVSKEIFYKVTDNLKESFMQNQEFSVLNMFGKEKDQVEERLHETELNENNKTHFQEKNPFKYDSSDNEDEIEDIADSQDMKNIHTSSDSIVAQSKTKRSLFWTESFFFKDDDYRLQEGFDFIERIKLEEKMEFTKLRRDLKEIVKAKIKNNQRKNRPFKKKLGGSKRKKMIRIKKALKR